MNLRLRIPVYAIFLIVIFLTGLGSVIKVPNFATLILIPFVFLLTALRFGLSFNKKRAEVFILLGILCSGIVSLWYSVNYDLAIQVLQKQLGVLLVSYIIFELHLRFDILIPVIIAHLFSLLILIGDVFYSTNISISNIFNNTDRDQFLLNANMYSYFIFFGNIGLFYLYEKFQTFKIFLLLIFLPVIFLIIIFFTASRGGLLIFILCNSLYWLLIYKGGTKKYLGIKIILITSAIYYLYDTFFKVSFLAERSKTDSEIYDQSRGNLIDNGIDIFLNNPFFGVGPGQTIFHTYSGDYTHISFLEVAVTQGFLGLLLLLFLFYLPWRKALRLVSSRKNAISKLNFLFISIFIIYNFFYPFYLYPDLMVFFSLICGDINKNSYI